MNLSTTIMTALATSGDSAYVLSRDLRLVRTNEGWRRFALENGGGAVLERWTSGASIADAILPVLRAFYVAGFERALATGERWEHDYECSSPEMYRRFRMIAYPVDDTFLVVANSLLVEEPHVREASAPDDSVYTVNGVISMCSHCRRVCNPTSELRWDWVPEYVRAPPRNLSHGLCQSCMHFYYGAWADEDPTAD